MATQPMVPMISPDGQSGDIPANRVNDALAAGFKGAVVMTAPDGSTGYIPHDRAQDAVNAGFKVGQASAQAFADRGANNGGFGKALGSDLLGMAKGAAPLLAVPAGIAYQTGKQAIGEAKSYVQTGKTVEQNAADERAAAGHGNAYQVGAGVNEALGVNVKGMEQSADTGDVGGVLGHAAAVPTAMAATAGIAKAGTVSDYLSAKMNAARTAPQVATVKGMAQMAPTDISGLEDIYRAAAPTGKNVGFRENLNAALPDLKAVAQDLNLQESKGGIISPDMRTRATVDALNARLDSIAKNERVAQIQRNAGTPVDIKLNTDARRGMEFLANNAGESGTQQLAASALKRGTLPIEQADVLAQSANEYLKSYEKLTPDQKLSATVTNPKIGGLKELDRALGGSLNDTLTSSGEVGLRDYERRYAGLSAVRDALQDRMNAAELKQEGVIGAVGRITRPAAKLITGGKSGIASASQAAVADVDIGARLQSGFKKLSSPASSR